MQIPTPPRRPNRPTSGMETASDLFGLGDDEIIPPLPDDLLRMRLLPNFCTKGDGKSERSGDRGRGGDVSAEERTGEESGKREARCRGAVMSAAKLGGENGGEKEIGRGSGGVGERKRE